MATKVKLQLGDIIEIVAPNDIDIHNHTYYIEYIDADKIRLAELNEGTATEGTATEGTDTVLTLTEGNFDNESIENIVILSRAKEQGFARQNNLLIDVWIDIVFGGELPVTFTGKITNLEEDKIEITTFPEKEVIFLDFAYQGLPEDLQIEQIKIRRAPDIKLNDTTAPPPSSSMAPPPPSSSMAPPPSSSMAPPSISLIAADDDDEEEAEEEAEEDEDQLRTLIISADQINFGEELEPIAQMVDVPEEEQRYDIEKQLDDLLDDMLASIPNAKRTDEVKGDINKMIQRFKQLREKFSTFDENGYAVMPAHLGAHHKPLVKAMEKMERPFYWVLPVVKMIKKIYLSDDDDQENNPVGSEDTAVLFFSNVLAEEDQIKERYEQNDTIGTTNKYEFLQIH